MQKVNENKDHTIELIKHHIKDLSFENHYNIFLGEEINKNNFNIKDNVNILFRSYKKNCFTIILKYTLECSSQKKDMVLSNLELDYIGFFKVSNDFDIDQKTLTQNSVKLLFPYAKKLIEEITRKGGGFPVLLQNLDFNLITPN